MITWMAKVGGGGSAEILPFFKLGRWGKCGSKVETCKAQQIPYFIYVEKSKSIFRYCTVLYTHKIIHKHKEFCMQCHLSKKSQNCLNTI